MLNMMSPFNAGLAFSVDPEQLSLMITLCFALLVFIVLMVLLYLQNVLTVHFRQLELEVKAIALLANQDTIAIQVVQS